MAFLADRVDELDRRLSKHMETCDNGSPCPALEHLTQKIGEITVNVELSDAKVDALAKRVGAALLPAILDDQKRTRDALSKAKRAGIAIAVIFGVLVSAYQTAGELGLLKSAQAQQQKVSK